MKKPYEKPAVIYKERIEARASSCGVSPSKAGTGTGCSAPFVR